MKILKPNWKISNIFGISNILKENQIKKIIFDKDNCISLPSSNVLHHPFVDEILYLKKNYSVHVLSNSIFFQRNFCGINAIRHLLPKPFCLFAVFLYFNGDFKDTVIVGDRVFTDILLGKILGIKTILIDPIQREESFLIRIIRKIEKKFI